MVINKRKKNTRQRGSHTHGWGSKKKHRGAGNRGGRGNAGSGKKGDGKKPSYWKIPLKKGFVNKNIKVKINPVNIDYIEEKFKNLLNNKTIKEEKGIYSLNLQDIGINKLLSQGKMTKKIRINVSFASKKAIEKIKEAGGEVILK